MGLKEIDKKIEKINAELDEMSQRTKAEKKAAELIENCKFDDAVEILKKI